MATALRLAPARVEISRLHPEQRGNLFGHDLGDQGGEIGVTVCPGRDRAPIDDDARGLAALRGEEAAERHFSDLPGCRIARGHIFDGQLEVRKRTLPAAFDPARRVHDEVVEDLAATGHRGDWGPGQRASWPSPMSTAASAFGGLARRGDSGTRCTEGV